ncbi:MAG: Coenzyme F420 hydrogenase/dehydrogenase, beta subunit C-terminal domain [Oscillospiraceae bacterium]|nr:Coenzyme F420 hydrogenase/dehydrogenase, beta subunit C-terminal domain [Oscillospiraceae bacterium]
MKICDKQACTGCGMCTNICAKQAISMVRGEHGFLFPYIDQAKCVSCGLCQKKCPANNAISAESSIQKVYAAWNKDRDVRAKSTSGGIFSLLAHAILEAGGVVVGVRWTDTFQAEHCMIDSEDGLELLYGSKYVQSNTGDIYKKVKQALESGKKVLFSGTPCQNNALRSFLGKPYDALYQIDLICHGVPSNEMLQRYLRERDDTGAKSISNVRLRHKKPYWDYCNVTVDFTDGSRYSKPTVEDSFFTLFNIGFSLRTGCRHCQYANQNRRGDITLADFWGFLPHNFKMRNYNGGVSCVLINSDKGQAFFDGIRENVVCEEGTVEQAKNSNKALSEPFSPPQDSVDSFWTDYENGMLIEALCKKHIPHPFTLPNYLWLRRMKRKYEWVIMRK